MSTQSTKKCKYCNGPVRYVDSPIEGYGAGEPARVDRMYHCLHGCDMSRLTGECGHDMHRIS
ncbi:hypothetical protein ACWESP_25755 [Nocardia beijingensis]